MHSKQPLSYSLQLLLYRQTVQLFAVCSNFSVYLEMCCLVCRPAQTVKPHYPAHNRMLNNSLHWHNAHVAQKINQYDNPIMINQHALADLMMLVSGFLFYILKGVATLKIHNNICYIVQYLATILLESFSINTIHHDSFNILIKKNNSEFNFFFVCKIN